MKALTQKVTVELLLRIGVAFSFLYPPVSAFFNPYSWVGFFPLFVTELIPIDPLSLLLIFGALEIAVGAWILFGRNIFIPSTIAAALLAFIIVFNLAQIDVLFRDIPILLMALCLVIMHAKRA